MARPVLAGIGTLFVGIAAVGVVLPGIPTVGPLIIASVLLTKSSPALEKRLVRNWFFARYLPYLDGSRVMPIRTKVAAIAMMWSSIAASSVLIYISGDRQAVLLGLLALAGIVGTAFIIRYGRRPGSTPGGRINHFNECSS